MLESQADIINPDDVSSVGTEVSVSLRSIE